MATRRGKKHQIKLEEIAQAAADRIGLSLPEYLLLNIAMGFAITPVEAATFLGGSKAGDIVDRCCKAQWVRVSPSGRLMITAEGLARLRG